MHDDVQQYSQDLPLSSFPILKSSELDEVCAAISTNYHPMKMELVGKSEEFQVQYNHAFLDGMSISAHKNTSHFQVRSDALETIYILQFLSLQGCAGVTYKGEQVFVKNGTGAIVSPFGSATNDHYDSNSQIAIRIDRREIEAAYATLTGHSVSDPIEFQLRMDLNDERIKSLQQFILFLTRQLEHDQSIFRLPRIQVQIKESLLYGLLYAQPHTLRQKLLGMKSDAGPEYVARAEEYLKEHLTGTIRMKEVAKHVGISLRALQLGFKKYRDYSMREFIKRERLHLARKELLTPRGRSILEIILACGFNHQGQFSKDYFNLFGETPSQTMARASRNPF